MEYSSGAVDTFYKIVSLASDYSSSRQAPFLDKSGL